MKPIFALLLFVAHSTIQPSESVPSFILQKNGPATLLANVPSVDGVVHVRFSGVFELAIELAGDRDLEVEPPEKWIESPTWKIKNLEPATLSARGDGWVWRQNFILDPTGPTVEPLALKPLRYRNAGGPWRTVEPWQPLAVQVIAQMKNPDATKLRENPTIEELPAPTTSAWMSTVIAMISGTLTLAVCALWILLRGLGARPWIKSSADIALYELSRLDGLALPARGRTAEFHTLLANVVRRFLEKRYQFPARRLTTEEFLGSLEKTTLLNEDQKAFLRRFLRQCDLAKFAEAEVSVEDCREMLRQTQAFIEGCR